MISIKIEGVKARFLKTIIKENGRSLNFENKYIISSRGQLFCVKNQKLRDEKLHHSGYNYYTFRVKGKALTMSTHQLVWQAFNGHIKPGLVINHINAVKTDNNLKNLEVVTRKENAEHAAILGLYKPRSKKVLCVETGVIFTSRSAASRWIGLNRCRIAHALAKDGKAGGYTWKKC